jgi:pimeloyl-ACP methyl ester carboxylesterase
MGWFDTFWHRSLRRPYRLPVSEVGKGPTTVVLLHGIAASRQMLLPLARLLDPIKYRVLVPDLLGFGEAPKPAWPAYTADDHARTLLGALKKYRLQAGGPVVIVGHSMGCLIATHIAATNPGLVKRLVLYEPPLLGEIPEFPRYSKRSARYKSFFEFIASHPELAHVEARLLWRIARKLWGTYLSEEEWVPFERSLRNTILEQGAYDELMTIQVPTDIVYGRLDLVVIRRGIERLFGANRHVRLHLVTDFHGISKRSALYLAALIQHKQKSPR